MMYRFARWLFTHVNPDSHGFRHVGPLYVERVQGRVDVSYLLLIGRRAITIWTDAIMVSQHKGDE